MRRYCFFILMVTLCVQSTTHTSQRPQHETEYITKLRSVPPQMKRALQTCDVEGVRTALRSGIYSHEFDAESDRNQAHILGKFIGGIYKTPTESPDDWKQRYVTIANLFFTETDLPITTVVNIYDSMSVSFLSRRGKLIGSYTLLQRCFTELWSQNSSRFFCSRTDIPALDIAKMLITRGARLHHTNAYGRSALHNLVKLFTSDKNAHLSNIITPLIDTYPSSNHPLTRPPLTFARDIAKIDFDKNILASDDFKRLHPDDLAYVKFLYELHKKTNLGIAASAKHLMQTGISYALLSIITDYLDDEDITQECKKKTARK